MMNLNNLIYIGTYGHVACIDQQSGKELWRTSLPGVGYVKSLSQNFHKFGIIFFLFQIVELGSRYLLF